MLSMPYSWLYSSAFSATSAVNLFCAFVAKKNPCQSVSIFLYFNPQLKTTSHEPRAYEQPQLSLSSYVQPDHTSLAHKRLEVRDFSVSHARLPQPQASEQRSDPACLYDPTFCSNRSHPTSASNQNTRNTAYLVGNDLYHQYRPKPPPLSVKKVLHSIDVRF